MPTRFLAALLLFNTASLLLGAEWQLVYRHGKPVKDNDESAWPGHIDHASWLDAERIVFATHAGMISCVSTDTNETLWTFDAAKPVEREKFSSYLIDDWSLAQKAKRIAILLKGRVIVIDGTNGSVLLNIDREELARVLGLDYAVPSRVSLFQDGRLLICNYAGAYGSNGYILDSTYKKHVAKIEIDAHPKELSLSSDGQRLAVIAEQDVLCVTDLATKKDIFFAGKRIKRDPKSITGSIDTPFFSHIRHDGKNIVVCTRDNSWSTGQVEIHDVSRKKKREFDAHNGHIEMDVDFERSRIALTGTSRNLILVNFQGKLLASLKNATQQRNVCIAFAPTYDRVLVGSWDNTVSVFKVVE